MIHNFKNYVLRHEPERKDRARSDIGAARAVLRQYTALGMTEAETAAMTDITAMLDLYEAALIQAAQMINKGASNTEIDSAVRIDDQPALRGLRTLRAEVRQTLSPDTPLSKARLIADLRADLGYGGMIHEFKNYVLRHEPYRIAKTQRHLDDARKEITQYRNMGTTRAENLALEDIETVLLKYRKNLHVVTDLIGRGYESHHIDQNVRVDDSPALRGLDILGRENARQIARRSDAVSEALDVVNSTLKTSTWGLSPCFSWWRRWPCG